MDDHALKIAKSLVPRLDALEEHTARLVKAGRIDNDIAPVWLHNLRYVYPKVLEHVYPELPAAMGQIRPIDNSASPEDEEWVYEMVESFGFASWVDDDGRVAPNGACKFKQFKGGFARMAHKWSENMFDMKRAAKANRPLSAIKGRAARRVHEHKAQWTWLFGDVEVGLHGLCTHPNITRTNAPAGAGAGNPTSWLDGKTDDEVLADIELLVDTVSIQTLRAEQVAVVYMPHAYMRNLKHRILGTGDGGISLWDWVKKQYSGDDQGQGKVEFRVLNECTAANRVHPEYQDDRSGITGYFMIALPAVDQEKDAFMRSQPFTTESPKEEDFNVYHLTHSRIGGFRTSRPLAFHIMYFGA